MDHLLELLDDEQQRESIDQSPEKPSIVETSSISVDNKIGIRLTNRKISGADLLDRITDAPYHSPAQLCAYSNAQLQELLCDPNPELKGKTNLVSIGLLFSNSGTRLSRAGNAFCTFKIGNLQSGPCLSVLLFGYAYQEYCKLKSGMVVGLVSPRLLPKRDGDQCSVSVSEIDQVWLVGDARDYGRCKAMVRAKNASGQWVADGKRCPCHVDTRVSLYCQQHRKQQLGKKPNTFQKIKGQMTQSRQTNAFQVMGATQRPKSSTNALLAGRQVNSRTALPKGVDQLQPALSTRHKENSQLTNSSLQSNGRVRLQSRPPPMRYNPAKLDRPASQSLTKNELLRPKAKAKRRRAVNTDFSGFDGSVAVPKASSLFAKQPTVLPTQARPMVAERNTPVDILARQKEIAQQVLARKAKRPAESMMLSTKAKHTKPKKVTPSETTGARGSLFGTLTDTERETLHQATSRFGDQIDAEELARSRQVVDELELREDKQDRRKSKTPVSAIKREYKCLVCNTHFKHKPTACISKRHKIVVKFDVTSKSSKAASRQSLSDKSAADGGLVLGRGLEWSQRFSGN